MTDLYTVEDRKQLDYRWDDLKRDFRDALDRISMTGMDRDILLDRIDDFKRIFDRANSSYKS